MSVYCGHEYEPNPIPELAPFKPMSRIVRLLSVNGPTKLKDIATICGLTYGGATSRVTTMWRWGWIRSGDFLSTKYGGRGANLWELEDDWGFRVD